MDDQEFPPVVAAMRQAGREHGIDVAVRRRPAVNSLHEAAEILGVTPADIAKTMVVRRGKGDYLFVIVGGDRAIAWPKLRQVVHANRLSLPGADEALTATGYERGTITPIGSVVAWPLYIDVRLRGRRVAMGAGEHGFSAFVAVDALATGYQAELVDLTAD